MSKSQNVIHILKKYRIKRSGVDTNTENLQICNVIFKWFFICCYYYYKFTLTGLHIFFFLSWWHLIYTNLWRHRITVSKCMESREFFVFKSIEIIKQTANKQQSFIGSECKQNRKVGQTTIVFIWIYSVIAPSRWTACFNLYTIIDLDFEFFFFGNFLPLFHTFLGPKIA